MYGLKNFKLNRLLLLLVLSVAAPSAFALPPQYVSTIPTIVFDEGGSGNFFLGIGTHFNDPDGFNGFMTFSVSPPIPNDIGTVTAAGLGGRNLAYTGLPDAFGNYQTLLTVRDQDGEELVVTVFFQVTNTPDTPEVAVPLPNVVANEDAPGTATLNLDNHFFDPDLETLTYRIDSNSPAGIANASVAGNTLSVSAVPNGFGTATINVCAEDPTNLEVCDELTVDLAPVDDPPTVLAPLGPLTIDEDEPAVPSYDLTTIFEDVDSVLSYSVDVLPVGLIDGNVVGDQLTLTTILNQNGSGTIEVIATGDGVPISSTIALTINPVPDLPRVTAPLGVINVLEDQPGIADIDLTGHFEDGDGDAITFSVVENPAGIVNASLTGSILSLSTIPDANGTVVVTATATNADGAISDDLTINVQPVDDRPVLVGTPPTITFDEDQSAGLPTLDLDTVFTDIDTPSLTYTLLSNLPAGMVGASITGPILSFTPAPDQNGTATLVIRASDGVNSAVNTASVTVQINPVNDAPVVKDGIPDQIVGEDVGTAGLVPLANAFEDIDGDSLSYTVSVADTAVINAVLSGNAIELSTNPDAVGSTTVTVEASDGIAPPVSTTFLVTITPSPDAPRLGTPLADQNLAEDFGAVSFSLASAFIDVDGEVLTYSVRSNGGSTVVDAIISGGSVQLTSILNQSAPAPFVIEIEAADPTGLLEVAQFNVSVAPVNDPPTIIVPNPAEFLEDTAGTLTADASAWFDDVDIPFGDTLTYSVLGITGDPVFVPGSVFIAAGSTLQFEIAENESGFADVTVQVTDSAGVSDSVDFRVLVNAVNDPPMEVAPLPVQFVLEDESGGTISLAGVFMDDDIGFTGDNLTYTVDPIPGVATFSVSGEIITVILEPDFNTASGGAVPVTVTARDILGLSDESAPPTGSPPATSTFDLEVTPVNDTPIPATPHPGLLEIQEIAGSTAIPLAPYFDDVDFTRETDTHTYSISGGGTSPLFDSITVVGGDLVVQPSSVNTTDNHTVMVIATDAGGLNSTAVNVDIRLNRIFALAEDDAVTTNEGQALNTAANEIDVLANDQLGDDPTIIISAGIDVDLGDAGFFTDATQSEPTNSLTNLGIGQLAPNGRVEIVNNKIHYYPKEGFNGTDFFDYTIRDADGDESTARVTITVIDVNSRPEVNVNPTFDIFQGGSLNVLADGGLSSYGFDPDGDTLIVSYDNIPDAVDVPIFNRDADGSFTLTPDPTFTGTITFTIRFSDGVETSIDEATVTVTVAPTPPPPAPPPAGEVEFDMNLSDVPLEDAISTEANVLIVMDDSGSMDWDMMTDQSSGVFRLDNVGRQGGIRGRGVWYYYIYDLQTNVYNRSAVPTQETIDDDAGPGEDFNGNRFGVWRLRNPQYSTIYYNPEIEYQPWRGLDRNNNDFANAPPAAAPLDPFDATQRTIDLTATHTFTSFSVPTFRNIGNGLRNVVNSNVYFPYYYTTTVTGRPDWDDPHTKVTIDNPSATYPGSLSRLDCAENDGNPLNCSYAEELQNFANWFTYYRTREYTAKAALGRALADSANLRMGYAVLNDSRDRVTIQSLNSSFRAGHKADLLEQVYETNSGGGTPLRRALDRAGRHFQCTSGDSFGSGGNSAPGSPACPVLAFPEGQCQNNFTLLFSDGTWNGSNPNVSDTDGNSSSGNAVNTVFDGGVFADGRSNTLADVAMHYYERDLHPSLSDGVPTSARDTAFAPVGSFLNDDELMHQHMKTYTVGFGVVGNVELTDLPNFGVDDEGQPVIDFTAPFTWGNPFSSNTAKTDDMLHAALNGRGQFLQANNPVLLAQAFQDAFEEFADGSVSVSAVAFGSTRLRAGTVEYRGFFNLKFNSGDLEAIELLDPATGLPPAVPLVWSAAAQMALVDPGDRKIFTYNRATRTGQPFRYANLNNDQRNMLSLLEVDYLRGDQTLEEPSGAFRARNSVLGDIVNSAPKAVGAPQGIRRDRAPFPTDKLYSAFRASQENRRRVVYVGANDGMLHAFDAGFEGQTPIDNGTGNELFAYVPNKLIDSTQRFNNDLDQLASLVYSHKYFVDLTPAVEDAFIRPNGSGTGDWRTMLVGGLRGGGKGYFALDITNPDVMAASEANAAQSVLWEFTDADDTYPVTLSGAPLGGTVGAVTDLAGLPVKDLGYTYSEPRIVMTNVNGSGPTRKKWAAVFGNGYNSTAGIAKLFVLFVDDGVNGWQNGDFVKVNTGEGTIATNPSNPALEDPMAGIPNGLGQPTLIDTDLDGVADTAYAGDLQGHLYRFDIGDENPANWKAVKLFTATFDGTTQTRQSITTAPNVTKVPDQEGFIVTFGTGSFITEEDGLSTDIQSIYGIWDRFETSPPTADASSKNSLLVEQSITNIVDDNRAGDTLRIMTKNVVNLVPGNASDSNYGWYIDLDPVRATTSLQGNPNTDTGGLAPPNPQYPGERAIRRIVKRANSLVITSVIPRDANSCFRAPPGAIWFIDALSGGDPGRPIIDLDNDGVIDSGDLVTVGGEEYAAGLLFDAGSGDGSLVDPSVLLGDGDADFLVINKSHGEDPEIIRIIKDGNRKTGRLSWWEILGE